MEQKGQVSVSVLTDDTEATNESTSQSVNNTISPQVTSSLNPKSTQAGQCSRLQPKTICAGSGSSIGQTVVASHGRPSDESRTRSSSLHFNVPDLEHDNLSNLHGLDGGMDFENSSGEESAADGENAGEVEAPHGRFGLIRSFTQVFDADIDPTLHDDIDSPRQNILRSRKT